MNENINENVKSIMDCLDTAISCIYCDEETAFDMMTGVWEELSDMLPRIGVFAWIYDGRENGRCVHTFGTMEEAEKAMKEEITETVEDVEDGELTDDEIKAEYKKGYDFDFTWKRCYKKD